MKDESRVTERLDEADRLLGSANDDAIDIAMACLAEGEMARAALIAAEGFQGKDMETDALNYFDRSIAASPTARAHAGRGMVRYVRFENDEALADFDRAVALDPGYGLALHGRGLVLSEKGETALALESFSRAAETPEFRGRALFRCGQLHLEAGRIEAGERDLLAAAEAGNRQAADQLAERGGDTSEWPPKALLALAEHFRLLDEPDREAEASVLESAIEKLTGAEKHAALMSLGFCQRGQRDFDGAIATFRRAAEIDPKGPAPANIARTLYLADRNRKAEKAAKAALASGAEPFEAHRTLGELCAEEERHDEALVSFDQALAVAPRWMKGHLHLMRGRSLIELGRDDEAREAWIAAEKAGSSEAHDERLERFEPETGGDFFSEGVEPLQEGEWEEAREPLERSADLYRRAMRAPGDFAARQLAGALTNLGNALRQAGEVEAAVAALEEACRVHPMGYEPLVMFANILRNAEVGPLTVSGEVLPDFSARLRKSLELLDRAVTFAHGQPYPHYNRGHARLMAGHFREAASDFERALAYSDPSKRQDAVFNLVKSLWKAAAFEEARARCSELYVDEDVETMTRNNIAAMLSRQPQYQGNFIVERFSTALDTILELVERESSVSPDAFPFRFYGVRPANWAEGANMGHEYRLRFREVPDSDTRAKLAEVVARPWAVIDHGEGSSWLWSGPFVQLNIGELDHGGFDAFFAEVVDMMKAIHAVAPLDEVVALNAQSLSDGTKEENEWERWSLSVAPLPSAHPFVDDGALFFSAYGDRNVWPAPASDDAFDEARSRAIESAEEEEEEEEEEPEEEDA